MKEKKRVACIVSNPRKQGMFRWLFRIGLFSIVLVSLLLTGAVAFVYGYFSLNLPKIPSVKEYAPKQITEIYAGDYSLIGEFYLERRIVLPIQKIPKKLVQAFIASEDSRFFEHLGIDLRGILRAIVENLRAGRKKEGASTITQQLARSFLKQYEPWLFFRKKAYVRKIREMILSRYIESVLTKKSILYLYLNNIYLGHHSYGVQAAAQNYFDKNVWDLSLSEMAIIAGLPQAPSKYSPYFNFKRAKERQRHVLRRMNTMRYISKEEEKAAYDQVLDLKDLPDLFRDRVPYFTEHVRRYVLDKYKSKGLYEDGLKVHTTVNTLMQNKGQIELIAGLRELDKRQGFRGPVSRIASENFDQFITHSIALYGQENLKEDRPYLGIVRKVALRQAEVQVADKVGILKLEGAAWASNYNPAALYNYGLRPTDLRKVLSEGDVIYVRVQPRKKGKPKVRGRGNYRQKPPQESTSLHFLLEQDPKVEGALISFDPVSGYVKTMVGGKDFDNSEFNRAFQACRQPGSVFKPLVYSKAIDLGWSPATLLVDAPVSIIDETRGTAWQPKNYGNEYKGNVILREALVNSMNIPSVRVLQFVGYDTAVEWSKKLGISTELKPTPSLVLGASCVYPWDITGAFGVFAARGLKPLQIFIKKIEDRSGEILEDHRIYYDPFMRTRDRLLRILAALSNEKERIIDERVAYVMQTLLREVVTSGTGFDASRLKQPASGKTGTTDAYDAWFVGYTENYVTGVWVGEEKNERILGHGETGGKTALPIWMNFMKYALGDKKQKDPTQDPPEGVVAIAVNPEDGLLAIKGQPSVSVYCVSGTQPKKFSKPKGEINTEQMKQTDTHF